MYPKQSEVFDSPTVGKRYNTYEFEQVLKEYMIALEDLKQRTITKYGLKKVKEMFPKWFEDA